MMTRLRHRCAQTVAGQYAVVFFVVIAAVMSMALYLRRGLQGRIYDARNYMEKTIEEAATVTINKNYEPYYLNRETTRQVQQRDSAGRRRGVYRQGVSMNTFSNTQTGQ